MTESDPKCLSTVRSDGSRSGGLHLLRKIHGKRGCEPARQRGFPNDQLPVAIALPVFAAAHEGAFHFQPGTQQVLPSVPTWVPHGVHDGGIDPELKVAAYVAAQRPVVIEIAVPQRQMEPAAPMFR